MKKIKIAVPEESFDTLNTKYPADSNNVSNDSLTAGTKNIETSVKGVITKRKGGVVYSTLPNPPRDQYEAIFSDGARHLLTVDNGNLRYTSGDGTENLVLAGLSANLNFEFATTQDRVYFGNGIQKKVYNKITSYGGVSYTFPTQTVRDMGAAAPSSAPTVAVAAGGSVPVGVHTYKVTFVYYDSEESNGGLASSSATTTAGNQTVNLTNIPIGGYGTTQRKIYRDNNDGVYVFVGVINNNTGTTFSDTIAAGLTPLPDDQGLPPDFTLISLYLDRLFLAGISGDPYVISFSDVGMPDIYPVDNYITCNQEDPITGIVVYLDRLIVFNRRSMGQILGKTSDQFRYSDIQSSVGCVDNRSIQIRVIDGVPVLVWLSDKGFYAYNGNSVVYISDVIEDQINSNIQQSVIQKNRISHSDYTTFTSGTKTDGINLEANQGTITTKGPYWDTVAHPGATYEEQTNPKKQWDTQAEFELAPSINDDTATKWDSPRVSSLQDYWWASYQANPHVPGGSFEGGMYWQEGGPSYEGFRMPVTADHPGETITQSTHFTDNQYLNAVAQSFVVPRAGAITSITVPLRDGFNNISPSYNSYQIKVHRDVAGSPAAAAEFDSGLQVGTNTGVDRVLNYVTNIACSIGERFWIAVYFPGRLPSNGNWLGIWPHRNTSNSYNPTRGYALMKTVNNGTWRQIANTAETTKYGEIGCSYTFNVTPLQSSGSWTSPIYDTHSIYHDSIQSISTGTNWSGNGSTRTTTVIIEGSNDGINFTQIATLVGLSHNQMLSTYNHRYYRVKLTMVISDNRYTDSVYYSALIFNTISTWISEPIDCTADVTSYDALVTTQVTPGSSSIAWTVATSDDNITYTSYGPIGSALVKRYIKLKAVLTKFNSALSASIPYFTSVKLSWHLSSTFTSPAIDTAVDPSGWEVFQASSVANGGTLQFAMRSASTSGGLAGATWYNVTNGEFPTSSLPTLQWVQWKVSFVSNPDQIPTVDSVTVGWFVGTASQGIRCASLFFDKNYYVALAEFEEDTNNLLYVLDFTGKWRLFKDLNVATLSYFFNSPYYGDAVTSKMVRFLEGTSDQGNPIELDVRTKAFDGSTQWTDNEDKVKVLDHVIVSVTNTGATFDCHYSVDEGMTFNPLYDTSGNNSWVTTTDGKEVKKYLRPRYTTSIPQGRSLMFKIHNNDTKQVQLKSIKAEAFAREQPPIITG